MDSLCLVLWGGGKNVEKDTLKTMCPKQEEKNNKNNPTN